MKNKEQKTNNEKNRKKGQKYIERLHLFSLITIFPDFHSQQKTMALFSFWQPQSKAHIREPENKIKWLWKRTDDIARPWFA